MSDPFVLRPQQFIEVERVRVGAQGCDPVTTEYSEIDAAVWDGMRLQPAETTCLRTTQQQFNDAAFASWSWDTTSCVDMLPFTVSGWTSRGIFTQISSYAAALGIQVGTRYAIRFGPCDCMQATATDTHSSCASTYEFEAYDDQGAVLHSQRGDYNWTRVSRHDPNDGIGGANMQASVQFKPLQPRMRHPLHDWGSIWIARERFAGSWQSVLGIALFTLTRTLTHTP